MLTVRMQRVGRKGHAQFRIIVQDSRFSPKSGRVVAYLGSYDPHSKVLTLDKDKISTYLTEGAQPSDRVAKLLQKEGLKLPDWVKIDQPKKREIRHPEKLRRNRPAEPKEAKAEATPVEAEAETPIEQPERPETANTEEVEEVEASEPATPETPTKEAPNESPPAEEEPAETTEPAAEKTPAEETSNNPADEADSNPKPSDEPAKANL